MRAMSTEPRGETARVDGLSLHYLTAGEGPAVLLLHGWPTSSFLWRDVIPPVARTNRVLALDLPGFGRSDKPLDASYSFRFYERVLGGFLDAVGARDVGVAVHDLGGPVGLYWALRNLPRVRALALLNTLVYPTPTWALVAFLVGARLPGVRSWLTSPAGLAFAMRVGVADPSRLTAEAVRGVQAPFATPEAREALLLSVRKLHPRGMMEVADRIREYRGPARVIYGAKDRILPDVGRTMARVARELPQAEVTRLDDCGHFLQEERGPEVGAMLGDFFAKH